MILRTLEVSPSPALLVTDRRAKDSPCCGICGNPVFAPKEFAVDDTSRAEIAAVRLVPGGRADLYGALRHSLTLVLVKLESESRSVFREHIAHRIVRERQEPADFGGRLAQDTEVSHKGLCPVLDNTAAPTKAAGEGVFIFVKLILANLLDKNVGYISVLNADALNERSFLAHNSKI